ncbi:Per1-like protein [Amylostereum chailletii]|nr:Per1-like protein [Amylostereum chailletii]
MRATYLLHALAFFFSGALASSGDRSPTFQACVTKCEDKTCSTYDPPFFMRLAQWSCTDDCKYTCMQMTTDHEEESGVPVQQYYGKWPFYRFAGMQEPASVLFSFLNLLLHAWGLAEVKKAIHSDHPMRRFYIRWSYISCNAWIWSSVFHTRDTSLTEKLDYFSAALTILYSLYLSVIRICHFYPAGPQRTSPRGFNIWSLACIAAYICHVSYLTLLPRFDYTYNIVFNLILGLVHNSLWLAFSLPASLSFFHRFPSMPKSYRPAYATIAAQAVVFTTAATCLELFDFAPWKRVIDAHSLWHLATAPLAVMWYHFLIHDAQDPAWKTQKA